MKKLTAFLALSIAFFVFDHLNAVSYAAGSQRMPEELQAILKDDTDAVDISRKTGDFYSSRRQYAKAAGFYLEALKLDRKRFTIGERLQMAIRISWAGRLKKAEHELRLVLVEAPKNMEARFALARVLSKEDRLKEAVRETDIILAARPGETNALLLKADCLRWAGDYSAARKCYLKILEKDDDFYARTGLARTDILAENYSESKAEIDSAKPASPSQAEDLKKLKEAYKKATDPVLNTGYLHYWDTDHNNINVYYAGFGFLAGDVKFDTVYSHTLAGDTEGHVNAEEGSARAAGKLADRIWGAAAIGATQMENSSDGLYPTWMARTDISLLKGKAGVSVSRDVFTETADLIRFRIRYSSARAYIAQTLWRRLDLYLGFAYKNYSDHNDSRDWRAEANYKILAGKPVVRLGYRFRHLSFNTQTEHAYFDPDTFFSSEVFASLYYEKGKFYTYVEPYTGYESYRRFGEDNHTVLIGGAGTLGLHLLDRLTFELNAGGGNFSLATVSGFKSYMVEGKLLWRI